MNDNDIEFRIAKLELKPGDILVLKVDYHITKEAADRFRDALDRIVPGQKSIVLDGGMELAVLTREEIEARAA